MNGLLRIIRKYVKNTKKQLAFTLAEVLITITIVGVVAALTLPILNKKINDVRYMSKLKQTYSIINQAIKLSQAEYGDVVNWGINGNASTENAKLIAKYLLPFLKVSIDCGVTNEKKCISNNKYKFLKEYNTNSATSVNYGQDNHYYKIVLSNGVAIWWRSGNLNIGLIVIFIDLNGKNKPNCWGKDLFAFEYIPEISAFLPFGSPKGTEPYTAHCIKNSDGHGCAYYVMNVLNSFNYKF